MIIQECKISKALFTCFCGLVSSGYNIGDPIYSELVNKIRSNSFLIHTDLEYFKRARVNTDQINPYWPNGFLLTVCCLYLDYYGDLSNFEAFLKNNNDLPNEIKSNEMLIWISKLPDVLKRIQSKERFADLWSLINDTIVIGNQDLLTATYNKLNTKIGEVETDLELQVIINPLQAYEIADFLSINKTKYIIVSRAHIDSIVHEYLHIFFDAVIENNGQVTESYIDLLENVFDAMYKYQYADNHSNDSWRRVFEEHFVRAATIWFRASSNRIERDREILLQEEIGFKYIKPIVYTFERKWSKDVDKDLFWKECLEACRKDE